MLISTARIHNLFANNKELRPYFRGVFSKDQFFRDRYKYIVERTRNIFVVNTETSDRSGNHWVLFVKEDRGWIYFDSFGLSVGFYGFLGIVPLSEYSNRRIQGFHKICGLYCLFVASALVKYKFARSLKIILSEYFSDSDSSENDKTILNWAARDNLVDHNFRRCLSGGSISDECVEYR